MHIQISKRIVYVLVILAACLSFVAGRSTALSSVNAATHPALSVAAEAVKDLADGKLDKASLFAQEFQGRWRSPELSAGSLATFQGIERAVLSYDTDNSADVAVNYRVGGVVKGVELHLVMARDGNWQVASLGPAIIRK